MAIIKRTPRPGELVRGATAGDLAAFGPDGELVDSGLATEDVPEWPEGGNEGDVLSKGADGPEWVSIPTVKKTFLHSVRNNSSGLVLETLGGLSITVDVRSHFQIFTDSDTAITSAAALAAAMSAEYDNSHPYPGGAINPTTTTIPISGVNTDLHIIPIVYNARPQSDGVSVLVNADWLILNASTAQLIDISHTSHVISSGTTVDKVTEV